MRTVFFPIIAALLAATAFSKSSVSAEPTTAGSERDAALPNLRNAVTIEDLRDLFVEYLLESGVSAEDAIPMADSARDGLKECVGVLISGRATRAASFYQHSCNLNVLQEHPLLDAFRWISSPMQRDKGDDH